MILSFLFRQVRRQLALGSGGSAADGALHELQNLPSSTLLHFVTLNITMTSS
jgi:hypothetical protein